MTAAVRMLAAVALSATLVITGCGGDEEGTGKQGGPEVVSGVTIDESSPEAAGVTYVKLIDTCDAKAAERAFAMTVDPKAMRAEAIEELAFEVLPEPDPSEAPSEDDITPAVTQRAEERFKAQGLCDDPN